ncbi:type II toxin-antitoxin system RelE family toxin [Alkalibacter saccharofermentans]|uniref:mRNA interferase RelE/StbE n=1 Tax=Alkalibacter saccharofermentans DSM 14828 TaxID=1120975 RepID=A0A1M4UZC9_9FIRM|nr:type II toxin-antitoxin system RelE/ParE family toxin [Alkalibacter saccharofermentans]SHE62101.1 mRNA interferase RelE/StbE [Alkalibacter saccharofermentans DSM 14828]
MSEWQVEYTEDANDDLKDLDGSQRLLVLKAIKKVSKNPLPYTEGVYGKPLVNHNTSKLAGYQKIKLKDAGIRVVYSIVRDDKKMRIIIISIRDDEKVYKMAQDRIK